MKILAYILLACFLLAIVLSVINLKAKPKAEPFDLNSVSPNLKLLASDTNGNITLLPNLLNDLQGQINTLNTQLQNQSSQLTSRIDNIINGSTHINNLVVDGPLSINTGDGYPIKINKTAGSDKTALINYSLNGVKYRHWGLAGDGNLWCGSGLNGC